jgi:hypothetical protein
LYVPGGQLAQLAAPASEYWPNVHCWHVFEVWPEADCAVPARHCVQEAAEPRLLDEDHVPAGQGLQADAPASEYVPGPHCTQSVEPVAPGVFE